MTSESDVPVADSPLNVDDQTTTKRARYKLPGWVRSHPKLSIGVAALLVFAIGAVVVWSQTKEDEAESTVREYLEAVRANDLGRADSMLDSRPLYPATGDMLDPNWTIQTLDSTQSGSSYATVRTVLKADNGAETTFDFELGLASHAGSQLEIQNGYATVEFVQESAQDLRINGKPISNLDDLAVVDLYPGVYQFGHVLEDFIDADWQQRFLVGGSYSLDASGEEVTLPQHESSSAPWTFTADGDAAAQELIESHIDDCVEKGEPVAVGCPFGVNKASSEDGDTFFGDELDDVEWDVEDYPEVTAVEDQNVFRYADRSRGLANLTATAETNDGTVVDIDAECQMRTTDLRVVVNDEGDPRVAALPSQGSEEHLWTTC